MIVIDDSNFILMEPRFSRRVSVLSEGKENTRFADTDPRNQGSQMAAIQAMVMKNVA